MTLEQINIRETIESLGKRQYELKKANAEILDWAMKTVSGKIKVPLPQFNIYDYVPYITVPPNVQSVNIPFSQLAEPHPMPIAPPRQLIDIPFQLKKIHFSRIRPLGEPSKSPTEPKEKHKK